MDRTANEKAPLILNDTRPDSVDAADETNRERMSLRQRILLHVILGVIFFYIVANGINNIFDCRTRYFNGCEVIVDRKPHVFGDKVKLEAHIMSKCPDAKDCLQQLVVPTMEKVSDMVDFRLSYIGKIDPKSDEVHCMHGPGECLGNIIELCAQSVYPDPKLFLGFTNCMTTSYSQIPQRDLVEGCAMEHGIDFNKLNSCISEEGNGSELLRQSMQRSQDKNVTKSCTVRLEGKVWCIRDGGEWSDCPGGSHVSNLTEKIEELSQKRYLKPFEPSAEDIA